jgi:Desulfoferrodoxin, N-terminal domain
MRDRADSHQGRHRQSSLLQTAYGEKDLEEYPSKHSSKKGVLNKMPNLLGRRFRCEVCNTEVLITKAGEGEVECCGKPMTAQQPRPLPSSD